MSRKYHIPTIAQWCLFLAINLFFIAKYVPRAGFSAVFCAILYSVFITTAFGGYMRFIFPRLKEKTACVLLGIGTIGLIGSIITILCLIDPYNINVDRWSATTFFLDALFHGDYPYGVHTHVSATNYPSPFPLWHYLHIPFWLCGDVGIELIFFLLLILIAVQCYSQSYKNTLTFFLLLVCSPSYWWEIMVRSDGLSNAFLVLAMILFAERYHITLQNHFWLIAIAIGCLASTRLSALIPIALYIFYPYIKSNRKIWLGLPIVVLVIVGVFFLPYILWDMETLPFLHRNPFMSQTGPGNPWILGVMVVIAIIIASRSKTTLQYLRSTGAFMFLFMLATDLGVLYYAPKGATMLDNTIDISYFTLALPYCITALSITETNHG